MLILPKHGFAASTEPIHKVELDAICDWVEASLAFDRSDAISGSDIVDVLCEEEIYDSQSFAWEMIDRTLSELNRRKACMYVAVPFTVKNRKVVKTDSWRKYPAYAFCLALSCAKWYPEWASGFDGNYTLQGQLFEQMAAEALRTLLPDWRVEVTGWSPKHAKKIKQVVVDVAAIIREPVGELNPWVSKDANEAGLDIVCCRLFSDARPGLPTIFAQCASGKHHEHKLGTPNMKEWGRLIRFTAASPQRSFITPYVYTDDEFMRVSNKLDGLLLDRVRLLSAGSKSPAWLSSGLGKELRAWISPRIAELEKAI